MKFHYLLSAIRYPLLFISLFIFTLLFILPQPAKAFYTELNGQGPYSGTTFSVHAYNTEAANEEWLKTSVPIKIDVEARDSSGKALEIFPDTTSFYMRLAQVDAQGNISYACDAANLPLFRKYTAMDDAGGRSTRPDPKKVTFTLKSKGWVCDLTPGTYRFEFFSGDSNYVDNWFEPVSIGLQSAAGGGLPTLSYASEQEKIICDNRETKVNARNLVPGQVYRLWWDGQRTGWAWKDRATNSSMTLPLLGSQQGLQPGAQKLCILEGDTDIPPVGLALSDWRFSCPSPLEFTKPADQSVCTELSKQCQVKIDPALNNSARKKVTFIGSNLPAEASTLRGDVFYKSRAENDPNRNEPIPDFGAFGTGNNFSWTSELPTGQYSIFVYPKAGENPVAICSADFTVDDKVQSGNAATQDQIDFKSIACDPKATGAENRCANSSGEYCDAEKKLLRTAIGCVPVDPGLLVAGAMKYITGFAGGAALLMMIFGAFQMMTSGGNAEGLKKGREQFVSAIIGLLFVIFSVLLLQIIGVDLLGLPGFKK